MNRPDIKARLLMAGHNQSTIGAAAGVTQSAVSRVISGELVSPDIAAVIAKAVGSTAAGLWPSLYSRSGNALKRRRVA